MFKSNFLHKLGYSMCGATSVTTLKSYARSVVSGGIVKAVYLIGSTAANGAGRDIDLLYDFGYVGLPLDADEAMEQLVETTNINCDLYDSFYKADGRYFHLSWGAGCSIIENNEYAQEQQGKPSILLAGSVQ